MHAQPQGGAARRRRASATLAMPVALVAAGLVRKRMPWAYTANDSQSGWIVGSRVGRISLWF